MPETKEPGPAPLSNADLARVLSPLLLFAAHVAYLAFWSREPFLNKWLDGSFSFFLALVLCNIIRARVVASAAAGGDDGDEASEEDEGSGAPPGEGGAKPGAGQAGDGRQRS